jgi:hypothetical protein
MRAFVRSVQKAVAELGMTFPDVLFLINVNDAHLCEKRPREDGSRLMQSECTGRLLLSK